MIEWRADSHSGYPLRYVFSHAALSALSDVIDAMIR
jgi:hypothetical protein